MSCLSAVSSSIARRRCRSSITGSKFRPIAVCYTDQILAAWVGHRIGVQVTAFRTPVSRNPAAIQWGNGIFTTSHTYIDRCQWRINRQNVFSPQKLQFSRTDMKITDFGRECGSRKDSSRLKKRRARPKLKYSDSKLRINKIYCFENENKCASSLLESCG
jgi:hypothetical protein